MSAIFRWLGDLHGDNNFDSGVAEVCYEIAEWLEGLGL